jgi:hypothetical protein
MRGGDLMEFGPGIIDCFVHSFHEIAEAGLYPIQEESVG